MEQYICAGLSLRLRIDMEILITILLVHIIPSDSYRDILHHHKKPFYHKGAVEDSNIMDAYTMHSLNHVFRTRDHIMKNDSKLSKHQETAREEVLTNDSFLDQGFTRPKVLILLPLASIAFRFVRRLIQLTPSANKGIRILQSLEKIKDLGSEGGVWVEAVVHVRRNLRTV
ncbi:U3 small nucleolar RNA-associated protein 25 [Bienertia sinuspersici]